MTMEAHELKEKIHQIRVKYLDGAASHPVDQVVCSDEKKASIIKKKLIHLESLRCQKMRNGQDLTEIEIKIKKLKDNFKALETGKETRR